MHFNCYNVQEILEESCMLFMIINDSIEKGIDGKYSGGKAGRMEASVE